MGENTLDNCGQWTGKRDCLAPRRELMPRRDDANGEVEACKCPYFETRSGPDLRYKIECWPGPGLALK